MAPTYVTQGMQQLEIEAKRLMDEATSEVVAAVKEVDPTAEINMTNHDEWLVTCRPEKAEAIGLALVAINKKRLRQ